MVSAEKAGLRAGRPGAVRKGVRGWLTALPFILPGLILVAVFVLYPLLFTIRIALSDYQIVQGSITFIGLENFKKVLSGGSRFWYAYRNNFLYALVTVPFILLGGMLFAYLINNLRHGQGIFRVGFYLPVITSWVVVSLVSKYLFMFGKGGLMKEFNQKSVLRRGKKQTKIQNKSGRGGSDHTAHYRIAQTETPCFV